MRLFCYTFAFINSNSFPTSLSLSYFLGGADKNAIVFDKDAGKIVATLKGHSKKVTNAVYHPREVSTSHTVS